MKKNILNKNERKRMKDKKLYFTNLLEFKDFTLGSKGFLRISISISKVENNIFEQIMFCISITNENNYTKSCYLNIIQASELMKQVKYLDSNYNNLKMTNDDDNDSNKLDYQILRKYGTNTELILRYFPNDVVELWIGGNSDFSKIRLSYEDYMVGFCKRLNSFILKYDDYCIQLRNYVLQCDVIETNKNILSALNNLPYQISELNGIGMKEDEDTIHSEMKDFIGGEEVSNIDFDENTKNEINKKIENKENIESEEKKESEIKLSGVQKLFDNDLFHFENMLIQADMQDNPIDYIRENYFEKYSFVNENEYYFGMDEKTKKTLFYLPKLYCRMISFDAMTNGSELPHKIKPMQHIIQNNGKSISSDLFQFVLELFIINNYVTLLRRKLSTRSNDLNENCSFFHVQMRYYLDHFIFSIMRINNSIVDISTIIRNEFERLDKTGFFKTYTQKLEAFNLEPINSSEVASNGKIVFNYIKEQGNFNLGNYHIAEYNSGKINLNYDNNFTIDEIVNTILPLEILNNTDKSKFQEKIKTVSEDIQKIFLEKNKSIKIEKKKNTNTAHNLYRLINYYREDIPQDIREEFLEYIQKNFQNQNIDLFNFKYPLEKFGENILKILYLWQPEDDEKIINNYKHFFGMFEECIMTKEMILLKYNEEKTMEEEDDIDDSIWDEQFNLDD
jgi:hypothetical protein